MGRKTPDCTEFEIRALESEQIWDVDGIPILRGRVSLPQPSNPDRLWRRIGSFYRLQSRSFFKFCQRELRPWAETEYKAARIRSAPLPCFDASLEFRETYRSGRLWSVRTELRENAAPGPPTLLVWGDTWDLISGYPVALSDFFPSRSRWKRQLLTCAATEIERRQKRGLSCYHADWRRRLRKYFNPRSYFLTPDGIAFFYPMYALGPAAEGVPTFLRPWDGAPPSQPLRIT